jgi:hypothetical protein
MTNDINDFTTQAYKKLIQIAKGKYNFVSYGDYAQQPFVLWRHDCDFSLERSLRLAEIEHHMGVRSTFFINMHSEFYNIFEKKQTRIIKKILSLGHDIGLHFDSEYHNFPTEDRMSEHLMLETKLLETSFKTKISAFSFHNPNKTTLTFNNEKYAGLINCYSSWFKNNVAYCSDSNGYWRHERLEDVLNSSNCTALQVLTHPGWWQEDEMQPYERIKRCVYGRARQVLDKYVDDLKKHGRINVKS